MTPHIVSPTSRSEALQWLAASASPFDSPTQRRIRSAQHLEETFGNGRRRAEWVWAARDGDHLAGVVAAYGTPFGDPRERPVILDLFGLPTDPRLASQLVAEASEQVRAAGGEECCLFAPAGSTSDSPVVEPVSAMLLRHGWRVLVERRHYEFRPTAKLGADVELDLRLEQLDDPADPRLAAVHREVMRATLDAHDAAAVHRLGFEDACRESLAFLLASDPVECIRLAVDAQGSDVGMVSVLTTPTRRGFLLFVGVAHEHRGHGYGRQLLGWASRHIVAAGVDVAIADTDNDNHPMARAFADVGWPQTETRIDFVPAAPG